MKKSNSNAPAALAGAVDEDTFTEAFKDVPMLETGTLQQTEDILKHIRETLSDPSKDWNRRQNALKKIRSLLLAEAHYYGDFPAMLKPLELPLQACLKDLRSQVVREACISIAFLAVKLGSRFDKIAEFLLPQLMILTQNSAKVVSTSGRTTVRFIIQTSFNPRLITLLTSYTLSSKSKDIRRCSYEFLALILNLWPSEYLEKHMKLLHEAIRRGIADADQGARVYSREAFQAFRYRFPDRSEILVQSLDMNHRKALLGDSCITACSSQSKSTSTSRLNNVRDAPRRGGLFTRSAIDVQAAQRAKVRSEYAALSRNKITDADIQLISSEAIVARAQELLARSRTITSSSQLISSEATVARAQERLARSRTITSNSPRTSTGGTGPKSSEKHGRSKNRSSQSHCR